MSKIGDWERDRRVKKEPAKILSLEDRPTRVKKTLSRCTDLCDVLDERLAELRAEHAARGATESGRWTFRNAVGDAAQFHVDNPGATFQVASQFNALEFVVKKDP